MRDALGRIFRQNKFVLTSSWPLFEWKSWHLIWTWKALFGSWCSPWPNRYVWDTDNVEFLFSPVPAPIMFLVLGDKRQLCGWRDHLVFSQSSVLIRTRSSVFESLIFPSNILFGEWFPKSKVKSSSDRYFFGNPPKFNRAAKIHVFTHKIKIKISPGDSSQTPTPTFKLEQSYYIWDLSKYPPIETNGDHVLQLVPGMSGKTISQHRPREISASNSESTSFVRVAFLQVSENL